MSAEQVEGHEGKVLLGARRLFAAPPERVPCVVILEFNRNYMNFSGVAPEVPFQALGADYICRTIDAAGNLRAVVTSRSAGGNIYCWNHKAPRCCTAGWQRCGHPGKQ